MGPDSLFVAYRDTRPSTGNEFNVWANRSTTVPLAFGTNEQRVDADDGSDNLLQYSGAVVATDGASHVYVGMMPRPTGPLSDSYVAVSADSGRTFAVPVRVNANTAGSRSVAPIDLSAQADGHVYALFARDNPSGTARSIEVVLRRSLDYGVTWQAEQILVSGLTGLNDLMVASTPEGLVYATFSNIGGPSVGNIWMCRSGDFGATFTIDSNFDGSAQPYSFGTRLCAQGARAVAVYTRENLAVSQYSAWGRTTSDGGLTWSAPLQLRPELASTGFGPDVACDGVSGAVAAWEDDRSGRSEIWTNRFDGTNWLGDIQATGPASGSDMLPSVVYTGTAPATHVAVLSTDNSRKVYFRRSIDGGATWLPSVALDDAAPQPLGISWTPYLVTDGTNLWATWQDGSAGSRLAIAMRHSADHGASWSAVRRLSRETPQGSRYNQIEAARPHTLAALPNTAFAVFTGERGSSYWDTRINAWQLGDLDRDGVAAGLDCNDENPAVLGPPTELDAFGVSSVAGGVRLDWTSQSGTAGPATTYDIVGGDVAALLAAGSFAAAACLQNDHPAAPYYDLRSGPDPGGGWYYLGRAQNGCDGTYGDSGQEPDPRDALDAGAPCP